MNCIWTHKKFFLLLGILSTGLFGCGESQVKVLISPRTVTVPTDQPFQFTVEVTNTADASATWCVEGTAGACVAGTDRSRGDINATTGLYTPPAVIPTPNTVTVRVASTADPSAVDTSVVTLVSGNMLRFGENFPTTDYSAPASCTTASTPLASTFSSGQHSIKIYQKAELSTNPVTYVFMVWADNHMSSTNNDIFFRQIILDPNNTDPNQRMICDTILTVNTTTTGDQIDPSLAVDSSGNVYIAWTDNQSGDNHIYVARGTFYTALRTGSTTVDNGIVGFGDNAPISDGTAGTDQSNPSVGTNGSNIYVAWQDNRSTVYNIRFAMGTPTPATGTPLQNSFTANASVPVNTSAFNQTSPALANIGSTFYVVWADASNANLPANTDIFFSKSTDGSGTTWLTTPVPVSDDLITLCSMGTSTPVCYSDNAVQDHPSMTLDTAGNIYVAWEDNRDPLNPSIPKTNFDIYFAKSTNAGMSFDAVTEVITLPSGTDTLTEHNIRVNDDTATNGFLDNADQARPSITVETLEPNATLATPNKIYIAWQDNRLGSQNIITAKSLNGGNTFWRNSAPADHNPATSPSSDPSITVDTFGRAYLIWAGISGSASNVFFAVGQ